MIDAERLRWIAVIVGLVVGGILVAFGFVTGENWIQLAGSVLGIGSGGAAVALPKR